VSEIAKRHSTSQQSCKARNFGVLMNENDVMLITAARQGSGSCSKANAPITSQNRTKNDNSMEEVVQRQS
jgi:hypothetical protein